MLNKFKTFTITFISAIICLYNSFAQQPNFQRPQGGGGSGMDIQGSITGKIVDKSTEHPLEYASVALYKQRDSSLVNGTITNDKGIFKMEKVPAGRFYLMINYIGYKTEVVSNVFVNPKNPDVDLQKIPIESNLKNLTEVVITDKKEAMEFNLDKKVINVEKNVVSAGGTALDVMQTIPSVTVDIDGNVSLRGSSNVIILVDGRPSGLTSLDQLPASMIESIEIVTNPSARYDPEGTSGLINIVLKKKKAPGYNGMISLNAGTGDKYNGSLNINYRKNKVNVYANYDFRFFSMRSWGDMHRESYYKDTLTILNQKNEGRRKGNFHNAKLGFDYFIDKYNTISASALYNTRNFNMKDNNIYSYLDYKEDLSEYFIRKNKNNNHNSGFDYNINYKKTFEQRTRELTADLFCSMSGGENTQNMEQDYYALDMTSIVGLPLLQKTNSKSEGINFTAQVDYVHPLNTGARVETGFKNTTRLNQQDYQLLAFNHSSEIWVNDTLASNIFKYDQTVFAGYGIYSQMLGQFRYQLGLRIEEALTKADQKTSQQVFTNDRFDYFPSVHLKYDFSEKNSLQLSYSRRINRPGMRSLNPFINYADPENLSFGNPYLKPEFFNAIELGHSFGFKKTNLNTTLFYRTTNNLITRITTMDSEKVSLTTYKNMNSGTNYGLEFIVSQMLLKSWKVNVTYSYFRNIIEGEGISNKSNDDYSWNLKLNSFLTVWKNMDIQVTGFYTAPIISSSGGEFRFGNMGSQGIIKENYGMDIGLKKDVLKDKATVSLRVSDVFKTQRFDITSYGENFTSNFVRRRESRVIFVGFSYRINDYKRQRQNTKKKDENQREDSEDF